MNAKMNIPELRFAEFSGEWEVKKLGDISKNIMYGMNSSAIKYDGIHKYIRITDIDESTRNFLTSKITSPDGEIINKFKLVEGDVLFARTGASVGKSYIYKEEDGNLYFAGFLIKFNICKAVPYFIFASTLRDRYSQWVSIMSVRSGQPGINAEEYKLFPISLPSKPEQEKIASFLSSVDAKIEQLSKKQKLLEEYKKGAMQKIFSQEIRFKDDDGSEYPEWVEKKLGDITSLLKDGSHGSHKDYNSEYLLLSAKNIKNGQVLINKDERRISENDYKAIYKNYSLKNGDILLSIVGTIGRSAIVNNLKNIAFQRSVAFFRFDNMNSNFMFQLFNTKKFQNELNRRKVVSAQPGIYLGDLSKIQLNMPSKPEQTKIANFLSAIDAKIELSTKELDATKKFKKALLQKMFV